jgi:hypothetical protein
VRRPRRYLGRRWDKPGRRARTPRGVARDPAEREPRDCARVTSPETSRSIAARCGPHAGRGDRARGGKRHAVCRGGEAGRLGGHHTAGSPAWRDDALGPARPDVNRYLKWAVVEAANAICLTRGRTPRRHVGRLYERVARRKGHAQGFGAVAPHLAEATYWMLRKGESYREPHAGSFRPRGTSAARPLIATSLDVTIMPRRRRRYGSDETSPRWRGRT